MTWWLSADPSDLIRLAVLCLAVVAIGAVRGLAATDPTRWEDN